MIEMEQIMFQLLSSRKAYKFTVFLQMNRLKPSLSYSIHLTKMISITTNSMNSSSRVNLWSPLTIWNCIKIWFLIWSSEPLKHLKMEELRSSKRLSVMPSTLIHSISILSHHSSTPGFQVWPLTSNMSFLSQSAQLLSTKILP